jgi:hypothetical protein
MQFTVQYEGVSTTFATTLTGDTAPPINVAVPHSTTNAEIDQALTVANLTAFVIVSDKDLTLKTNDSASPVNTLNLKAGCPVFWFTNCGWTSPLTANVTKFFATNGGSTSGDDATLRMWFLSDITP